MYECKNCSGNLKFDIASQKLKCDYCGNLEDPDVFVTKNDAGEFTYRTMETAEAAEWKVDEYEVTIFTCPQCGGELISDDTTAATFCSFCGGATILDSRISKERRPARIIPFQKTREDCKKIYKKMMFRAPFAPKELKDEKYLEKFRAIYMPFWIYNYEMKAPIEFEAQYTDAEQEEDSVIVKQLMMKTDVDITCDGLAYDASAAFSDNLSGAILPYEIKDAKSFTPAYLSGFYADTSDVGEETYMQASKDVIAEELCRRMRKDHSSKQYDINEQSVKKAIRKGHTKRELAMFPVWFLSYRKKDRVCYAVVNGQTGKAAADLPIDPMKYLIGSLLLAVPIFLLLNMFISMRGAENTVLSGIFALVCCYLSVSQRKELKIRETYADDEGLNSWREKMGLVEETQTQPQEKKKAEPEEQKIPITPKDFRRYARYEEQIFHDEVESDKYRKEDYVRPVGKRRKRIRKKRKAISGFSMLMVVLGSIIGIAGIVGVIFVLMIQTEYLFLYFVKIWLPVVAVLCVAWIRLCIRISMKYGYQHITAENDPSGSRKAKEHELSWTETMAAILKPLTGFAVTIAVIIVQPVSDLYYYGASLIVIFLTGWTIIELIRDYNRLTTRKLPQFNQRGGEENA